MTARVLVETRHLLALLGPEYVRELTFPQIFKDSRYSISPVLIERADGARHIVIGDFDSAAHMATKEKIPFVAYGKYFDWNQAKDGVWPSFAQAVRMAAGDGELAIEHAMPVDRYEALAATGPVVMLGDEPSAPVFVYAKSRAELEAGLIRTRDADVPRLTPFVSRLRFGRRLIEEMSRPAIGFAPLDKGITEAELDGVYVSAAFDIEMFTGLPCADIEDLGGSILYRPGEADILVFTRKPLERGDFRPVAQAPSLADALSRLFKGALGYQRGNLSIARHRAIKAAGLTAMADATEILRRWLDRRAATDLLYFITAANAVLAGIQHASDFIRRRIASGLTEREVAAIYHQGVQDFAASVNMTGRIHAYFDIIHPGERTMLPAMAGDYPIASDSRTIKFDMGLLVTDSAGCVRGCSDIARTISFDPVLQDLHDRLRALLVDVLIPAIRPGMTGAQIHALGVDAMRPLEAQMRAAGLMPADKTIDDYTRDCGHTLQRQTPATVHFLPRFAGVVETAMLGCTEFVWPVDGKVIACEDGYYITPDGAIPFTE